MVLPCCVIAAPPGVRVREPTTKPVTDGAGFARDTELSVSTASGRAGASCWLFPCEPPDDAPVETGEAPACWLAADWIAEIRPPMPPFPGDVTCS